MSVQSAELLTSFIPINLRVECRTLFTYGTFSLDSIRFRTRSICLDFSGLLVEIKTLSGLFL